MAKATKATPGSHHSRRHRRPRYFGGEEIPECDKAGITVTLPKPMTSNAKAEGRFGKQDFRYVIEEDVYVCPAGGKLAYWFATQEGRQKTYAIPLALASIGKNANERPPD